MGQRRAFVWFGMHDCVVHFRKTLVIVAVRDRFESIGSLCICVWNFMYVFLYLGLYVCVHIYIYICVRARVYVCICPFARARVCVLALV